MELFLIFILEEDYWYWNGPTEFVWGVKTAALLSVARHQVYIELVAVGDPLQRVPRQVMWSTQDDEFRGTPIQANVLITAQGECWRPLLKSMTKSEIWSTPLFFLTIQDNKRYGYHITMTPSTNICHNIPMKFTWCHDVISAVQIW
jgi:hypothetical protein